MSLKICTDIILSLEYMAHTVNGQLALKGENCFFKFIILGYYIFLCVSSANIYVRLQLKMFYI